jgi:dCTP deaminase
VLLSDRDIRTEIESGDFYVVPYEAGNVQPASIDLRLGSSFRVFDTHNHPVIDSALAQMLTREVVVSPNRPFVLKPGEFVLATTMEKICVPDYLAAKIEGRSSTGRLGLMVHSTAGWIDPGFHGEVTLELSSLAQLPMLLRPGMPVAQLCLFRLSSPAQVPYGSPELNSRYQNQKGATPARIATS